MATTKTRRDLVYQAFNILAPDAAQTPSAEDIAAVDAYVDAMVAELAAKDIVLVDDPGVLAPAGGDIDLALYLPLARWLANAAATEFGGVFDQNIQEQAERALRTIVASGPTFVVQTAEHY